MPQPSDPPPSTVLTSDTRLHTLESMSISISISILLLWQTFSGRTFSCSWCSHRRARPFVLFTNFPICSQRPHRFATSTEGPWGGSVVVYRPKVLTSNPWLNATARCPGGIQRSAPTSSLQTRRLTSVVTACREHGGWCKDPVMGPLPFVQPRHSKRTSSSSQGASI